MPGNKVYIALISRGLTKELVYYRKEFNIDVLVFLNMTDDEAKYEISETAWQDRAEWVAMRPFRTYPGWTRDDVIAFEEINKDPGVENVYIDY